MYKVFQFTINPPDPGAEIVMALLEESPFESFELISTGLLAYIKKEDCKELNLPNFNEFPFKVQYSSTDIEDQNWNAEWEANLQPVSIDQVYLHAYFQKPNTSFRYNICITPKMSFGTGHHPTTRLMCQFIQQLSEPPKKVWDIGTGTGVLAILSEKMGANEVDATDTDAWSLKNAEENLETNYCKHIQLHESVDFTPKKNSKDLIVANINKNILKTYAFECSETLVNKGILIISGFFETDVEDLIKYMETYNLKYKTELVENEWAALLFIKLDGSCVA